MPRFTSALALVLLSAAGSAAKPLPTLTPRQLLAHADVVVRAEALQPVAPTRFRLLEVLRGPGLQPGDTIALDDLGPHDLRIFEPDVAPRPRRVVQALLFLGPNTGTRRRPRYQPVFSGLRFWTDDGAVLVPRQTQSPGPYRMTVADEDWDALVRQARADCAALDRLAAARCLARPGPRNWALLEWLEQHRTDLDGGGGWGALEADVFQWVLASGLPEDGWAAARLYAELNRGAVVPLRTPAFATRAGRALLLGVALAEDRLEGDRVRALALLGNRQTLWPAAGDGDGPARVLGEQEQTDLIDRLTPLLRARGGPVRGAAARALLAASVPGDGAVAGRATRRALPALTTAYRAESPGPARDDLAEAVHDVGGPGHWQGVTGNPRGLLARLRDFELRGGQASFWLGMTVGGLPVYEPPTLVLERLDPAGQVAEKKEQPLPARNRDRPWAEGWDGGSYLLVEFAATALIPGTWRVTVRGTAGKDGDKVRWTAEPRTFVVRPADEGVTGVISKE
jgi:hypothetical protein